MEENASGVNSVPTLLDGNLNNQSFMQNPVVPQNEIPVSNSNYQNLDEFSMLR